MLTEQNEDILMFDGSSKNIQEIEKGDLLMGPDSKKRKVRDVIVETEEMFEIVPNKGRSFIANGSQMLTLVGSKPFLTVLKKGPKQFCARYYHNFEHKSKNFVLQSEAEDFMKEHQVEIINISVQDFIQSTASEKNKYYLYHAGIEFMHKDVPLDPYAIGQWLGDGTSRGSQITTMDPEVIEYFREYLLTIDCEVTILEKKDNRACTLSITGGKNKGKIGGNAFANALKDLNLIHNKHIPDLYKMNKREIQLQVLAGLIDSDGYYGKGYLEITQKNKKLSDDIAFLCFSLGFMITTAKMEKSCMWKGEKRTGTYYRMNIFGDGIDKIPTLLARKQCHKRLMKKRATCMSFKIQPIGVDTSYTFDIKGKDKRFLLSDFLVSSGIKRSGIKRSGTKRKLVEDNGNIVEV
jgi:intein/homing endonuclease